MTAIYCRSSTSAGGAERTLEREFGGRRDLWARAGGCAEGAWKSRGNADDGRAALLFASERLRDPIVDPGRGVPRAG